MVAGLMVAACGKTGDTGKPYTLTAQMPADADGLMAYLVDFDSGEKLDSAVVAAGVATFEGRIAEPVMASLTMGGARMGTFVLEPGSITLDTGKREATGTPLNERLNAVSDSLGLIEDEFRGLERDSLYEQRAEQLSARYNALQAKIVAENESNPIGLYYFLQSAYECQSLADFKAMLAKHKGFSESKRVKKLEESFAAKAETSPGKPYKDFAIKNHAATDSVVKLSDFIGRDGKWTLVDFWASWCGPCIRETKVIKEVLEAYGPKGLEVVGVAVWDEPENSLAAVAEHQLPWPQILNTGTTTTDLYGIMGIPCILLVDPEGNIVARDIRDESLRQAVARALDPAPADKN